MIDTGTNPFASLSGFFFSGDKNDPRVNPQLRQRIALALMARGTKYPKTFGEGLSAIGDAIGDRALMKQLMDADVAQQGVSPPGAPVAPIQPPGYAPPSDTAAEAPAVGAINRAITPPPAPAPAAVPPQAPGRGAVPLPMQPGAGQIVDPSEYNAIDAADPRNRYKPAPAYLAPALERNIQDPERRGYLGQLAGKEAQSAGEVSPTGAAGPFQFTRGTGAQYGIPGDKRFDPDASAVAANALTDDNVQALTAKLGREPTPGEMALAHQQGAGTAGNMLTGASNASASNLAVNNVPPGMAPGAAAQKIMGYYGMPSPVGGGRDAVAAALLQQQQPPPSGRPTVADYGQSPVLAFTGADAGNGVQAAPPAPSGIRAAPPQQVAQAQPQAIPGYVPPEAKDPSAAPIIGMKPREVELRNWLVQNQNNPYAAQKVAPELQQLEQERTIRQNEANEKYKVGLARATSQNDMREKALMDQPTRQGAAAKAAAEAEIYKRTGQSPEQFYPEMDKQKASIDQTVKAQDAQQLARKAIRDGVITGYGADMKVASAKFADWAFNNGLKGDLAANTEILRAAQTAGLSEAVKTINGEGGVGVSNTDVKIAQGTAGADINLQMKTIQSIMDRAAAINNAKINRYEEKVDKYLGGHPQELNYATNARPVAAPDKLKLLLESQADPSKADAMRTYFDEKYGPGAAELEIARFKRAQSRKGG